MRYVKHTQKRKKKKRWSRTAHANMCDRAAGTFTTFCLSGEFNTKGRKFFWGNIYSLTRFFTVKRDRQKASGNEVGRQVKKKKTILRVDLLVDYPFHCSNTWCVFVWFCYYFGQRAIDAPSVASLMHSNKSKYENTNERNSRWIMNNNIQ